ncbi:MAG: DUF1295 domain-containing protein [Parabacteroides sp.]|nr:DUF1295 domain-containing protein [Parabacteroides sp.]
MSTIKQSRSAGFIIITLIYLCAIALGAWIFITLTDYSLLARLFIADFWATVLVWFFGVLFKNSSVYDPYWSVAPPVMLTGYACYCDSFGLPVILLLTAVWVWAIRLTGNWAYTFKNLTIQDWRYDKYKNDSPKQWHIVNFFGINLMPTIIVFLAMIPGFLLIEKNVAEATVWTYAGCLLCILSALLQLASDTQAHRFRKEHPGEVCNVGLWKYSRHPNYLGEICMWWGVYFMLLSVAPGEWFSLIGATVNTLLFVFISIPLMEQRQLANKPGHKEYKEKTRMLF